ncbi:MAG: hypothetical protein ACLR6B_09840 [Blautia sp.]
MDSREPEVGAVRREDILGRAFFRLWPLSRSLAFSSEKHKRIKDGKKDSRDPAGIGNR